MAFTKGHRSGYRYFAQGFGLTINKHAFGVIYFGQNSAAAQIVLTPLIGNGNLPGIAIKQSHFQVVFQRSERAHYRSKRGFQTVGCRR